MKTISIQSDNEFRDGMSKTGRSYLLLYKSGSEKSDCAYANIQKTSSDGEDFPVFTADVSTVRDIHPVYQIKTVPTLLEFDKGEFRNVYKGCHQPEVLKALFEEAVYYAQMAKEGKTVKQVTVYSTPTCTWCTTLKTYLNKNKIRFSDVDISRDPNASQTLVARSGQQGVPQTEVNGQWVVGFDKKRLNELLEIK
ncbi:MAG: glutaredoxin family protein [Bacteroidales bacterium]|nr:glutaredoxin family protein [Bacteroidales bacterium]